jgi:uncharacterized protein
VKFLLLVALCVFAGMWLLRAAGPPAKSKRDGAKQDGAKKDGAGSDAEPDGEAMVRCKHCGMYFPRSEAVVDSAGMMFCGEEHRRQHAH